ncbi:MAG: carbohydrate ABC transporter permease [Candidatus Limnocylindria bacterium]
MLRSRWGMVAAYGGLTAVSVVWLIPLASVLMTSLRPQSEIREGWWHLRDATFTFENYVDAWNQGLRGFVVNSIVITCLSVALTVAVGALAAYAFSFLSFPLKGMWYFLLITTMIVPIQLILIPLLPWFRSLGFDQGPVGPFVGIALVHTAFGAGWAVFMITSFMRELPDELLEAATIDGAGHRDVFLRVVLPLSLPGIVSFAIIDFIFVWNDLLLALTLLGRDYQPLPVGLANLQSPHLAQDDIVSAGAMMAILPPVALFVVLNRYYVRGLFAGSNR